MPPSSPWIIVPTYNESSNIERLIRELFTQGVSGLQILVVDDDSPDGTSALVRTLSRAYSGLRLATRIGVRGRGSAGLMGIALALEHGASEIIEMDADFSHPPSLVPDLLQALRKADIAIASRLLKDSRDTRPFSRRLITLFANLYARAFLQRSGQLCRVRDWTSGYRAYKRRVFELIPPETLYSTGPSVLQEVLFQALESGCLAAEVPFTMVDREAGISTFSRKVASQSLRMIPRYRFRPAGLEAWRMADYAVSKAPSDSRLLEIRPRA